MLGVKGTRGERRGDNDIHRASFSDMNNLDYGVDK